MKNFLFILLVSIAFSGCEKSGQRYLPPYSGKSGEVQVVMNDVYWDSEAGDIVRDILEIPAPGLANAENSFTYNQTAEKRFGSLLRSHRNLLVANIKDRDEYDTSEIKFLKDRYANGQLYIEVTARTPSAFIEIMAENRMRIIQTLNQLELERLMDRFEKQRNVKVKKHLQEKHNLAVNVPKDFEIVKDTTKGNVTFVWIRRVMEKYLSGPSGGNHPIIQNLMIYYYPYGDTAAFTTEYQLKMRDMVAKSNVPGPIDGSYMTTERKYVQPTTYETSIDSLYALQVSGNWKLENAFMGGPFTNVSVLDEGRNRIISMDASVYAPKFGKREYMREMEAMIHSIEIADEGM